MKIHGKTDKLHLANCIPDESFLDKDERIAKMKTRKWNEQHEKRDGEQKKRTNDNGCILKN